MLSDKLKSKYPYFTDSVDPKVLADEWEQHVAHVGSVDKATEWLLFHAPIKEVK